MWVLHSSADFLSNSKSLARCLVVVHTLDHLAHSLFDFPCRTTFRILRLGAVLCRAFPPSNIENIPMTRYSAMSRYLNTCDSLSKYRNRVSLLDHWNDSRSFLCVLRTQARRWHSTLKTRSHALNIDYAGTVIMASCFNFTYSLEGVGRH